MRARLDQVVEDQPVTSTYLTNHAGVFNGVSGSLTAAGTVTGVGKCHGIRVFATVDSVVTITGVTGNVAIRAGAGVDINPLGTVTAPVVTWVSGAVDVLIVGLS